MPTVEELTIGIVNLEKRAERAEERIDKLERIFEVDAERFVPDAEVRRQERWHATYNAALPAVYAESINHSMSIAEVLHDAALYADAAHGPLEAPKVEVNERGHYVVTGDINVDARLQELASYEPGWSRELDRKIRKQTALDIEKLERICEGKVTPRPDINVAGVTVGNVNALVAAACDLHRYIVQDIMSQEMYGEMLREGMAAEDLDELETKLGWLNHCLKPFEAP